MCLLILEYSTTWVGSKGHCPQLLASSFIYSNTYLQLSAPMHALMLYSAYNHSKDRRMSYWDIHEFLAEEEKVEFSISQDAHLIDFLDPTKEGAIPADTTITTAIWLLNTLSDYLDAPNTQIKVSIPEDYRDGMENRYAAFEKARREQFRTTAELPYFYEIYEGLKKTTAHEERKISGEKLGGILEERAKLIISRACGIFEESRADPVTGSYSRFEMGLYKLTRNKALEYHRWKTA